MIFVVTDSAPKIDRWARFDDWSRVFVVSVFVAAVCSLVAGPTIGLVIGLLVGFVGG